MTAETDLLPCPFCGAVEPIVAEHPKAIPPMFRVICSGGVCHAVVEGRTLVRAKLMWNRRACVSSATATQAAEIEALRAEVERLKGLVRSVGYEALTRAEQAEARAERLAEALRWALPLASQGLEMCRLERLRCGHGDITGTYKNGETWAGIHQEEVDGLERAHAALEQEAGRG